MKRGKVVILGGNARSGKTTLAMKLAEKGFNRISFDTLNSALEDGLKMDLGDNPAEILIGFLKIIIERSLEEAEIYEIDTVIDMYDFTPKYLSKVTNLDNVEVYFLAYPNCSKEEIAYNVKYYAEPTDWIAQVNKKYFEECVERFYQRNKLIKDECEEYEFELIDTDCGDNRNLILDELFNRIINEKRT